MTGAVVVELMAKKKGYFFPQQIDTGGKNTETLLLIRFVFKQLLNKMRHFIKIFTFAFLNNGISHLDRGRREIALLKGFDI